MGLLPVRQRGKSTCEQAVLGAVRGVLGAGGSLAHHRQPLSAPLGARARRRVGDSPAGLARSARPHLRLTERPGGKPSSVVVVTGWIWAGQGYFSSEPTIWASARNGAIEPSGMFVGVWRLIVTM